MKYKLKTVNGRVNSLLKADSSHSVKNTISVSAAQHIIDTGNLIDSDRPDYPICVDGKWYFEGERMEDNAPRRKKK